MTTYWPISDQCPHFIPHEHTRKYQRFSGVFRWYKMGTLTRNGLMTSLPAKEECPIDLSPKLFFLSKFGDLSPSITEAIDISQSHKKDLIVMNSTTPEGSTLGSTLQKVQLLCKFDDFSLPIYSINVILVLRVWKKNLYEVKKWWLKMFSVRNLSNYRWSRCTERTSASDSKLSSMLGSKNEIYHYLVVGMKYNQLYHYIHY